MFLISHRGNLLGKDISLENSPDYIITALHENYDVEIDVWEHKNKLYLGHDEPTYPVKIDFIKNKRFWCHAKNIKALQVLLQNNIHCFWHQSDTCCLTSKKYIWCYPGVFIPGGIVNQPDEFEFNTYNINKKYLGICSDNIIKYKYVSFK